MRYGFGVDIFGENIKLGLFDETGRLVVKWKLNTPMEMGGANILPTVAEEIDRCMKQNGLMEDDIIGVGVGIPGSVKKDGAVGKCVNFGWNLFNLNRALAGLTGLRVCSSNIVNMSATGECWKGENARDAAFVAMNYGLGGAVICDGQVVVGAHGGGGEIGHMQVNPGEKKPCTCGRYGCAEQYVSPVGIARLAKQAVERNLRPTTLPRLRGFDHRAVVEGAEKGDTVCREVMDKVYDYTARVIANICCVTNPDTVILGGEFVIIGSRALNGISKAFHKYCYPQNENVRFVFSSLGTDACIYGAFKSALDAFGDE